MTLFYSPRRWLLVSLLTIAASVTIIVSIGPVWGIDFAGGTLVEVEASSEKIADIRSRVSSNFSFPFTVQATQDDTVLIRTQVLEASQVDSLVTSLRDAELISAEPRRIETIGPTIGRELRRRSVIAISLVLLGMIAYLAYAFRQTHGVITSWKFGLAAVYALLHDLLLVTALFVLFGWWWNATIDTLFVTAQLAILGYSVNDTIVLFHRFKRELVSGKRSFSEAMNRAMSLTLGRTLNTSGTTMLVLLSLLIFGGSTIRWFVVALLCGTITGTYSSLFVAPPLLWYTQQRKAKA